jgi:hypothetical protein
MYNLCFSAQINCDNVKLGYIYSGNSQDNVALYVAYLCCTLYQKLYSIVTFLVKISQPHMNLQKIIKLFLLKFSRDFLQSHVWNLH